MNKLNKNLNNLVVFFVSVILFLFSTLNGLIEGATFSISQIIMLLLLVSNPVSNIFKIKKKEINNNVYYILYLIILLFMFYVSCYTIYIYLQPDPLGTNEYINQASLFFSNNVIYVLSSLLFINIISLALKKNIIIKKTDKHKLMLFLIGTSCLFPLLNGFIFMHINIALSIAISIFSFIMIYLHDHLHTASELRKIYFILGALCLYIGNLFALYFVVIIYLQLDDFGLNI